MGLFKSLCITSCFQFVDWLLLQPKSNHVQKRQQTVYCRPSLVAENSFLRNRSIDSISCWMVNLPNQLSNSSALSTQTYVAYAPLDSFWFLVGHVNLQMRGVVDSSGDGYRLSTPFVPSCMNVSLEGFWLHIHHIRHLLASMQDRMSLSTSSRILCYIYPPTSLPAIAFSSRSKPSE